jgi:hypothetical protein
MKAGISVASVLLCAVCLNAQVATTISRLPGGSTEIRVQNNAPIELVALAIVAKIHGSSHAPFEAYDDSVTGLAPNRETTHQILLTPLAPHKEVKVQVVMLCGTDRDVIAVPPRADKKTQASCELEQPITARNFCRRFDSWGSALADADGTSAKQHAAGGGHHA